MTDSGITVLVRSWTVAGKYLIIDLSTEPPAMVTTDDVVPQAILQKLGEIKELIMSQGATEQAQLQTLTDGMTSVNTGLSAAHDMLAAWIVANQSAPLDFTPALNALSTLQATAGTMDALVPQAPPAQLDTPVADPGPPPAPDAPIDPSVPPDSSDPNTPPDLPAGGDLGTATDPGTGGDSGIDTGAPPPDQGPEVNPL